MLLNYFYYNGCFFDSEFCQYTVFVFSFHYGCLMLFIYFIIIIIIICLLFLARTSSVVLTRHHCLIPDFRGESLKSFTVRCNVCGGFFICFLLYWRSSLLLLLSVSVLNDNTGFLSNAFLHVWIWLFCPLLIWCITLVDFRMLNQLWIPGVNPTLLWCMILSICCQIQFASIILEFLQLWS